MKRDLLKVCGDTNAPGLTTKAYAVCSCDIDVFPGMKTYTNPGDTITLDGDITLDALKQFFTLNIVEDTGKLTENAVGETGSKSMESMYEGFIPGTGAANLEFIKDQLNACDVFVVKDAEGQMRVLGTKDRPAFLDSVEITTGATSVDRAGVAFTVKSTQGGPAPVYAGVIDLDPLT